MSRSWLSLALFEFKALVRRWPMRVALLAFTLWPLLVLQLSADRPNFQGQALREAYAMLLHYVLPLFAAGLGAAALQSGMVRSILTAPIGRGALTVSRIFSRSMLLLVALSLMSLGFMVSSLAIGADLDQELKPQGLRILESSTAAQSHSNHQWLAWNLGKATHLDLELTAPSGGQTLDIPSLAIRHTGEIGETSQEWVEAEWRIAGQEWQPIKEIEAAKTRTRIHLPAKAENLIELRLWSRRAGSALGIDPSAMRFHVPGGSILHSCSSLGLRGLLLAVLFLVLGFAASARFSQSSALVCTAGLFLLTIFGASIGFGAPPPIDPLAEASKSSKNASDGATFVLRSFIPEAASTAAEERFEREGISISSEEFFKDWQLSRVVTLLALALVAALLLMREREFMGEEEAL